MWVFEEQLRVKIVVEDKDAKKAINNVQSQIKQATKSAETQSADVSN